MTIYTKTLVCADTIWDKHNHKPKHRRTITIDDSKRNFNTNHRKDNGLISGIKIIDKKDFAEVIDARFYCTGTRIYCCLWIHTKDICTSGTDFAGGYGYNKTSSALNGAIDNCGISNFPIFSGSGCNREALEFLAKVLNIKNYLVVEFYA